MGLTQYFKFSFLGGSVVGIGPEILIEIGKYGGLWNKHVTVKLRADKF